MIAAKNTEYVLPLEAGTVFSQHGQPLFQTKRALVLLTDAYGGHGGIAKFNRDLLMCFESHPQYREIVVLPRIVGEGQIEAFPVALRFQAFAARGRVSYIATLIKELLRNRNFHAVVCGHIHLLPLAWLASRIARAPLVQICHGIEAWTPTSRWFVDSLVKKIDYLISVSELTRNRFNAWASASPRASFILPNSVDLRRFKPQPKNPEFVDRYKLRNKVVLMTLGRLERSKGVEEILEVLSSISRTVPNIVYMVVGGGTDLDRLRQKAWSLGVADRVIFTGRIDESHKVDFYNLADAFAMPGQGEGFGIVYLEAMACGLPVIGSTLDGSREALLDGKLGILVNPLDRGSVEAGIGEALRRGKGIPIGVEHFSQGRFRERVTKIFDEVADGAATGESRR